MKRLDNYMVTANQSIQTLGGQPRLPELNEHEEK
jgi:hypothetical protein